LENAGAVDGAADPVVVPTVIGAAGKFANGEAAARVTGFATSLVTTGVAEILGKDDPAAVFVSLTLAAAVNAGIIALLLLGSGAAATFPSGVGDGFELKGVALDRADPADFASELSTFGIFSAETEPADAESFDFCASDAVPMGLLNVSDTTGFNEADEPPKENGG
jgi:hypothetical protein